MPPAHNEFQAPQHHHDTQKLSVNGYRELDFQLQEHMNSDRNGHFPTCHTHGDAHAFRAADTAPELLLFTMLSINYVQVINSQEENAL